MKYFEGLAYAIKHKKLLHLKSPSDSEPFKLQSIARFQELICVTIPSCRNSKPNKKEHFFCLEILLSLEVISGFPAL